tara:strand:- start:247 stop:732 length:486 start_codon:yes stop_codon:yes gene_type:complete
MVRIDSKYIRFWSELTAEERRRLSIQMFSLFPQVLGPGSSDKYNPVSMWLVTTKQIINHALRDLFTAGGFKPYSFQNNNFEVPNICLKLDDFSTEITQFILDDENLDELNTCWATHFRQSNDALKHWRRQAVINLTNQAHHETTTSQFPINDFINELFRNG